MRVANDSYKRRREYLKSRRICVQCGKRPAFARYVLCEECLYRMSMAVMRYCLDPKNRAKRAEYNRRRREHLIRQGLCVICGRNPAMPDKHICEQCKARAKAYERRARRRRKEKKQWERPSP